MDLGLAGKRALVCAASKGLGYASALALAREGVDVVITGRHADTLEAAAAAIRQAARQALVGTAVGDISTPAGRAAALGACPDPDILVTNNGGPPPGDFRDWSRADWIAALDANLLSPVEMIRATVDGMAGRGFGRIVNITSLAVKMPIEVLGLSNAARSGLTGFVAGLARTVADRGVTINNLLPGPFATERMKAVQAGAHSKTPPVGRFGDPDEFGAVCAFLCSRHTGYMTGQNVVLDGGLYPGTL